MGALPVEGPGAVYVYADLTEFLKVFWLVQSVLDTSQARSGPTFGIRACSRLQAHGVAPERGDINRRSRTASVRDHAICGYRTWVGERPWDRGDRPRACKFPGCGSSDKVGPTTRNATPW